MRSCCFVFSRESPAATTELVQNRYPKRSESRHPPSRDGSSKPPHKKLKLFQERPIDDYDLVALFIDGKSFADEEIVIALGVTMDGQKIPLGFVESATENERICRQLIQGLIRRGLCYDQGLLVVLDGSKGLRSAVTKALKGYVRVHRCQWHKRENVVVNYLPERERPRVRRKLQKAYDCHTYEEAKAALEALKFELKLKR